MTRLLKRLVGSIAIAALLTAPVAHAQLGFFFGSAPILSCTGAATVLVSLRSGSTVFFTTPGTYTCTVSAATHQTFVGMAAGGGGGGNDGSGDGGGGGGSGSYSSGTTLALLPVKTYTLVVPPASVNAGDGAALTLSNTTDSVTLINLGGGHHGISQAATGTGGAPGTAVTGSNLHNGVIGGDGGVGATPGTVQGGTTDTNGAGSGGGASSADGTNGGQAGGAGKDQAGGANETSGLGGANGGRGGGSSFNGTLCGGGGGGQDGTIGTGTWTTGTGQQGCAKWTFISAP